MTRIALALIGITAAGKAGQLAAAPGVDPPAAAREIVERTNSLRGTQELDAVRVHPQLAEAARRFAAYMARTDRYAHDADGSQPEKRAAAQGYAYCIVAENIAFQYRSWGFTTQELARGFVGGWERSPGHRHNMLDRDVTEIGVGVAQSARSGRWYAVQMFGRPQSMRLAFQIANRSSAVVSYRLGDESFTLAPRVTRTHERCRAERLTLKLPGQQAATTLAPVDGARYAIEGANGRYRVVGG